MYALERNAALRRFDLAESYSRRKVPQVFVLHPDTVAKICAISVLPDHRRKKAPKTPKLNPFIGVIDAILEANKDAPRKQRHSAKRILEVAPQFRTRG